MAWALTTPVGDTTRKLVLIGYANHADKYGEDAWPSMETVAKYAECSVRTAQRAVGVLVAEGFMREGDQDVPRAKIKDPARKKYAPINYDVAMSEDNRVRWKQERAAGMVTGRRDTAAEAGRRGGSPSHSGASDCHPSAEEVRGDIGDGPGVTDQTSRGATVGTQTVLEPSKGTVPTTSPSTDVEAEPLLLLNDTETTPPRARPVGRATAEDFAEFYAAYPKRVDRRDAERAYQKAIATRGPGVTVEQAVAVILAGAKRLAADPNLPDRKSPEWSFIKHPATWLNKGSWANDEPLPVRGRPNGNLHVDEGRGPSGGEGFN